MRSSWMRKSGQDSHLLLLSEQPSAHSQDTCNETYGIPLACLQMSAEQRHAQALQAQLHKEQAARRQLEKQAAVLQVENNGLPFPFKKSTLLTRTEVYISVLEWVLSLSQKHISHHRAERGSNQGSRGDIAGHALARGPPPLS